ncbi:MAG: SH3 domain-containing protein [Clostridia bacterium]|nr:SH3 domain-containing protein [Clostridia bacterium]
MRKTLSLFLAVMVIASAMILPLNVSASARETKAGLVSTSSGNLNVRSAASTSAPILTSVTRNSYVTLISKSGSWWYVEYSDGKYGYCHSDFIKVISEVTAEVNVSWGSLNVRAGAGTSYAKIGSLYKGKTVVVLSQSKGWSKILYSGNKTGYVNNDYLKTTSVKYPSVSLKVPSFKQTDSRWADVQIGVSGKTIGQIGCVTTSIAMMESYRAGTTIYPDTMAKRLSYSSNGNVYWPSDYTVVTNSSGYLAKIYEQLQKGKPVLIGAKKSNGSQHWVVITGYVGGETLTTSGFTINDPGSNTRTNLQQFLNSYPTFYKFFYY